MNVLYPELEDHLELVLELCQRAGFHVRDAGALASALARPATVVFGEEQYPDLLTKAAVLLDSISRSHPLLDGNKRLAWETAKGLCQLNRVNLVAEPQEIDAFVRSIAGTTHRPLAEIVAWLEEHADLMRPAVIEASSRRTARSWT